MSKFRGVLLAVRPLSRSVELLFIEKIYLAFVDVVSECFYTPVQRQENFQTEDAQFAN
jgi:hypothetical protein